MESIARKGFRVYNGGRIQQDTARLVSRDWQRHADYMAGYLYVKEMQRREEQERHARRLAYMRQKGYGALLAALGVISVPQLDMDATAALLFVPLGLHMIFTKELLIESEGEL